MKIHRTGLVVGVVAGLALLCWRRYFFNGLLPVDGNTLTFSFPLWSFFHKSATHFQWPFWNPLKNMGEPFLADPQTMALYPLRWLTAFFPTYAAFWGAWILLHTALSAGFGAAWIHRVTGDKWAARTAALLFAANGFFLGRGLFPNHFASAAWLPVVLYGASLKSSRGVGMALGLQWLAGYPPFFLLTVGVVGLVAFPRRRAEAAFWLRVSLWFAGLSAVQWVPFMELFLRSGRPLILAVDQALEFSLPVGQLAVEMFGPAWSWWYTELKGDPVMVSFYIGLLPTLLCVRSLLAGGRGQGRWVGLVVLAFILSLGGLGWGHWLLSPLRVARYPANWLLVLTAGAIYLASVEIGRWSSVKRKGAAFLFVAADLLAYGLAPRHHWARPEILSDIPPLAARLAGPDAGRIYHTPRFVRLAPRSTLTDESDFQRMRDLLAPSLGTAYGVAEVDSYQVLLLRSTERFQARLFRAGKSAPEVRAAAIGCVVDADPASDRVAENNTRVAMLDQPAPRVSARGDVRILSVSRPRPERLECRYTAGGPGEIDFSEAYFPGWRAAIDGRSAPLRLKDDVFMCVSVPSGEHALVFRFVPVSFWAGLVLSMLSLALAVGWRGRGAGGNAGAPLRAEGPPTGFRLFWFLRERIG